MTYKEVVERFIKTEAQSIVLNKNEKPVSVRIAKVPVTETVQVLYMSNTLEYGECKHHFDPASQMVVCGFVDPEKQLRFPSATLRRVLEDTPELPDEDFKATAEKLLREEFIRLATAEKNPEAFEYRGEATVEVFLKEARNWLFRGKPEDNGIMVPRHWTWAIVSNQDAIIDFLEKGNAWISKKAAEWMERPVGGDGKSNMEVLREQIAYALKMKKIAKSIEADPNDEIHRFIEMRDAVAWTRQVTVTFRTARGTLSQVKMSSNAFQDPLHTSRVSLWKIVPSKDIKRVQGELPLDDLGVPATELDKNDIIGVQCGKKVLWPMPYEGARRKEVAYEAK